MNAESMKAGQVKFFDKGEQMLSLISSLSNWKLCRKTRYQVMVQKASADRTYGSVKEPGIVYNFFEDSMEPVVIPGFVITGIYGEMWPVPYTVMEQQYEVACSGGVQEIGDTPVLAWSKGKSSQMKAAVRIPAEILFEVVLADGKTILKGNRNGIGHGDGDYLVFDLKWKAEGMQLFDTYQKVRIKRGVGDETKDRTKDVARVHAEAEMDWRYYLEPAENPGLRIVNGALFQKTYEWYLF